MDDGATAVSKPAGRGLILRPRLIRLLEDTQSRVILLVAPAGYGKTTLARQWLTEEPKKAMWFRATSSSTDVAALALGLAKTAERVLEGVGDRVQERLRKSQSPNAEADELGAILGVDVEDWPADLWLVIDDYHHLTEAPEAEQFFDAFLTHVRMPVLITSRARPAWASAKRLLYGEIAEFGRNVLAMTHEEAARMVPRNKQPGVLTGLVALAEGWPAVIGLASLLPSPLLVARDEMPEALYSYFAEELYQGLNQDLQSDLAQLSLAQSIDSELASRLFGDRAGNVLYAGYARGFLNREGGSYDLHPLLRQFLRSKLGFDDPRRRAETVRLIGEWSISRAAWDEAFELANEFRLGKLLAELLDRALDALLADGRLATLEQWLEAAHRLIPGDDIVALAEVELAFRKGRWPEAEAKARRLAGRLSQSHKLASKALFRAAQVAQLDDRQHEALALLEEARRRSTTRADLRRALWNRFLTWADLEEPDMAAKALKEFETLPPESIEDMIRLSQGPVHFALRWGGIREELERHRAALDLLDQPMDPVVRSGFLQSYGTALALSAQYEEASRLADRQLAEAKRVGLDWVRPHGLELHALAQIGLRDFDAAEGALRTAHRLAEDMKDFHAQLNAVAVMARIPLAQGAYSRVVELLDAVSSRAASPGMEGEIRSIRALALACLGEVVQAEQEVEASAAISSHLEARGLRAFARMVIAHTRGDRDAVERLGAALRDSSVTGNVDAFVSAYRAFPVMLQVLTREALILDDPLLRAVRSYDARLAEKAGLSAKEPGRISAEGLTEREEEVLSLLRNGLSNQQIAHALWIAESTVKVHLRHIFEKLGVRSRTAAALFRSDQEL